MAPLYDRFPDRLLVLTTDPGCAPALVRVAIAGGEPARADATVAAVARLAARNPAVPSIAGAAEHARGVRRGDLAALRAAVEHLRSSPRRLARAAALADAGTAEHRAGDRNTATELWQQALDEYMAVGATRAAAQLEQQMRSSGAGRRVESRPTPRASAVAGLSAAELRVARLVARGMKNRQVAEELTLSRHTVDSHLRHIFTKLGVCSRVQMTRIIVACGALDAVEAEITTRGIP